MPAPWQHRHLGASVRTAVTESSSGRVRLCSAAVVVVVRDRVAWTSTLWRPPSWAGGCCSVSVPSAAGRQRKMTIDDQWSDARPGIRSRTQSLISDGHSRQHPDLRGQPSAASGSGRPQLPSPAELTLKRHACQLRAAAECSNRIAPHRPQVPASAADMHGRPISTHWRLVPTEVGPTELRDLAHGYVSRLRPSAGTASGGRRGRPRSPASSVLA
jgi:hypothetical protein